MKRALILVLSFDSGPYRSLAYTSKQTWDSVDVDGLETVFYFGDEGATSKLEYDSATKNLFTGTGEGLGAIGVKNIAAFEWALKNKDFDYIVRVNASTYVNKKLALEYVQNIPNKKCYLGAGAPFTYNGYDLFYAWGPTFTLSRDVVQLIVENKQMHPKDTMDDTGLGIMMKHLGVPMNNKGSLAALDMVAEPYGAFHLTSYNNEPDAGGIITELSELNKWTLPFIRCKQDWDRTQDVRLMHQLFNALDK